MEVKTTMAETMDKEKKSTLEELREMVMAELTEHYWKDVDIKKVNVIKNNGLELCGVEVMKKNSNIAATFYMDRFVEDYLDGKATVQKIAEFMVDHASKDTPDLGNVIDKLKNYEEMKDRIIPALVNYEANKDELEKRPYKPFLDLAITLYLDLHAECGGKINISDKMLDIWGVDEQEVFKQAFQNLAYRKDIWLKDIFSVLHEAWLRGEIPIDVPDECSPLYVVSNHKRFWGSILMTDLNVLGIIAEKLGCGFKIFPSNVHELLVLPDSVDVVSEDDRMTARDIADINRTVVDVEERLSNSIYHYDKETGEVSIFEQGEPL